MRHRFLFLGPFLLLSLLLAATPALATRDDNWHWHDNVEARAVFFPTILGQTLAEYLADPAYCPNATDKSLLGPTGINGNQPLNAGICMTSTTIIHIWRNPGQPAPSGWNWIVFNGNTFYYLLTDR